MRLSPTKYLVGTKRCLPGARERIVLLMPPSQNPPSKIDTHDILAVPPSLNHPRASYLNSPVRLTIFDISTKRIVYRKSAKIPAAPNRAPAPALMWLSAPADLLALAAAVPDAEDPEPEPPSVPAAEVGVGVALTVLVSVPLTERVSVPLPMVTVLRPSVRPAGMLAANG